jgi:predicted DNA binding CopG/RHH family protein
MIVTSRLSDELGAEIDRLASASGQSRAAWIASALQRAVLSSDNDSVPVMDVQSRGRPDDYLRVTVRLHRHEIEAIDKVAFRMALARSAWIKRTLRWALWDKAGELRLSPLMQSELESCARKSCASVRTSIRRSMR